MTTPEPIPLPSYEKPTGVFDALMKIRALDDFMKLSIHESSFKYGVYFGYVKKELGHGNFLPWVEDNIKRWDYRTVRRFMSYAEKCLTRGHLLPYQPSKDTKNDIVSIIETPAETEVVDDDTEEQTPALDAVLDRPVRHVSEEEAIAAFAKAASYGGKPLTVADASHMESNARRRERKIPASARSRRAAEKRTCPDCRLGSRFQGVSPILPEPAELLARSGCRLIFGSQQ